MRSDIPTFDGFVRTLLGDNTALPAAETPLSQLAVGDYAVLAWLDDLESRLPPGVEADLVARWDTASLKDVYAMLYADAAAHTDGVEPS